MEILQQFSTWLSALFSSWTPKGLRWIDQTTGCDLPGANPDCRAWHWTVEQFHNDPLRALLVVGGICLLRQVGPAVRLWLARTRLHYRTARYMEAWEAYRFGFFDGKGFALGDYWSRWGIVRNVCVPGVASIITVGGAGRRKGSGLVIPNVLRYAFQVCIDFSGEIAATVKAELERRGYKVVCINPNGLHMDLPQGLTKDRLNALAGIDPRSSRFGSLCRAIANALIVPSGNDPHWANSAIAAIDFLCREHIRRAFKEGRVANLVEVVLELTRGGEEQKEVFRRMTQSGDKFIAAEGSAMLARLEKSPKEFQGVLSNIASNLAWLKDETYEVSLKGHDIDYEALAGRGKYKGYVVFIILPLDQAESHAAWLRLCLNAIISEMIRRRPQHRILFTVDEAAVLGGWAKIKHALANLRKFKMQFHLIYHSLGEIKELFGESAHSMLANSFVKNFVGVNDPYTAKELSAMLGEKETLNNKGGIDRAPLARPEDILAFREEVQVSVVSAGRPLLILNRPYFHRPSLRRGLTQNPYYEAKEYPNIPALYPAWFVIGWLLTLWAMMRPKVSELVLGTVILGGGAWAILR